MEENSKKDEISDETEAVEKAKWYVIHTYSGYENKVAANIEKVVENRKLDDLIFEIKIPTEKIIEVKDNKTREVERKLYPGYVLVKMILTDDSWYAIRNIRGVTGFVGPGSKPVPLSKDEVISLGVSSDSSSIEVNFEVGDEAMIASGSLNGYSGIIENIDLENGIAKIIVTMFGRKTPVEVELNQIKRK